MRYRACMIPSLSKPPSRSASGASDVRNLGQMAKDTSGEYRDGLFLDVMIANGRFEA
jgi:hypothetical protein